MAIFAMILALTLGLHFLLNLPYLWVCAIMALIYEAPVFFKKQNLLDYLCKNHLNDGRQLTKPSTVPAIVNGDKPKEAVSLIEESVAHSDEKFHEVQDAAPEQEVGIEPVLETKTKTSLNSKAQSIAAVILLLIGLVVTHTLLSYFLADYYNNNYSYKYNEYNQESTANNNRLKTLSTYRYSYDKERFLCTKKLVPNNEKAPSPKLGPIPYHGKISTYVGSDSREYIVGYTKPKNIPKPILRPVDPYAGRVEREAIETDNRIELSRYQYKMTPKPIYNTYTWTYTLSSYDISSDLSLFEDIGHYRDEYLKAVEQQLKVNFDDYKYTTVNGQKALAYYCYPDIKRVLFVANNRIYLLEVFSPQELAPDLDDNTRTVCLSLNVVNYKVTNDWHRLLAYYLIFLASWISLSFFMFKKHKGLPVKNALSKKFGIASVVAAGINSVVFAVLLYNSYNGAGITWHTSVALVTVPLSALLIDMPLMAYFLKKASEEYNYDFVIPSWLSKIAYYRIKDEAARKLYVTFVGYPLTVLTLLPCGVILIPIVLAILIVSTLIIYMLKWFNWIGDNGNKHEGAVKFVDYYNILGIPTDAQMNDINVAYNGLIAQLNLSINTPKFDARRFSLVQEAYRVLNDNHIKALYDEELNKHMEGNGTDGIIANKELESIIQATRSNVHSRNMNSINYIKILLIVIVTALLTFTIVKCKSDNGNSNRRHHHYIETSY